ncbi:putative aminotransferase (pseudogene) (plasmid) [Streptococcus gallolyticus subsp. gallolyticus ATCC BAA-2069]|nr:putative aminotransferase (pseudogene) [Streptococcus gallolyticus subsp. gallolyticus ATCC BAA-2069]
MQQNLNSHGLDYRNIGIMAAIKTAPNQAFQLVKELEKLGILVYFYVNDQEEGLSIMPQFTIDQTVLEKTLKIIAKKVQKYQ